MNNSGEFRILFALVCFLAVAFCSRDVCYADMVTIKAESLEEDIRKDDCLSKFVKENVPSDAYLVDSEFIQNLLEIKKGEISDISAKFNSCVYSFVTDNDEGPFMCYTITDLYTKNATRLTKDDTLSISTDDCIYLVSEGAKGAMYTKKKSEDDWTYRCELPISVGGYEFDIYNYYLKTDSDYSRIILCTNSYINRNSKYKTPRYAMNYKHVVSNKAFKYLMVVVIVVAVVGVCFYIKKRKIKIRILVEKNQD